MIDIRFYGNVIVVEASNWGKFLDNGFVFLLGRKTTQGDRIVCV